MKKNFFSSKERGDDKIKKKYETPLLCVLIPLFSENWCMGIINKLTSSFWEFMWGGRGGFPLPCRVRSLQPGGEGSEGPENKRNEEFTLW